jgi:hypothetical protein
MSKYTKEELKSQEIKDKLTRRQAWEGFINQHSTPWDWFATLTFKDFKSIYSAQRHFIRWTRLINREIFRGRAKRDGASISWVAGYEKQERGALHIHALLANTDHLMRNHWAKVWWQHTGGYADVCQARIQGATHYLTKYILKDGEIDIDLYDEAGQRLTLDDPAGYTEAERGSAHAIASLQLPLEAN